MNKPKYSKKDAELFLIDNKIRTLEDLKAAVGTKVDMTIFRILKSLSSLSSYSHGGRFYTLDSIAEFDDNGLWCHKSVCFSRYGNLSSTLEHIVTKSEAGYFATDLERLLHVKVRSPLLRLFKKGSIGRKKISGSYLYGSSVPAIRKKQLLSHRVQETAPTSLPDEIKAAIVLFVSMLDEQQRRLYAGLEALKIGHGGDQQIAEFLGMHRQTVAKGRRDLQERDVQFDRIRVVGAGRKQVEKKTPEIIEEIRDILEFNTAGDPMSGKKWSRQTPGKIAICLQERLNIYVSAATVSRLLSQLSYSLKGNCKTLSAGNHPDRNEQFGIIENLRRQFQSAGDPVISVDTKKKELIGLFKNQGKVWCLEAQAVNDHDFRSQASGIAAPYGIYDVESNSGVVMVGQSADTPEFAVNSIALWWSRHGSRHYPNSKRLLILADSGGSNGARPRAFKKFLQERIANEYGLEVLVSHYPAGASKWNPIEHRMFSEISKNWAGHPLESFEIVLNFINNTRTETGLRIEAYLDEKEYEKGLKVSDKEFKELNISKNINLGNWNYSIAPTYFPEEIYLNSWRKIVQEPLETDDEWVEAYRECSTISGCVIPVM